MVESIDAKLVRYGAVQYDTVQYSTVPVRPNGRLGLCTHLAKLTAPYGLPSAHQRQLSQAYLVFFFDELTEI